MIRIALECALVFLLPAAAYFGYQWLMADPALAGRDAAGNDNTRTFADRLDAAPLGWLFALGTVCVLATLLAFATLQDDNIDQPYIPAILKNGQIEKGGGK